MNYTPAKRIADYLVGELSEYCEPGYCQIAGGVRREKADVHDIEIVCIQLTGFPRPEFGQKRIFTSRLDQALYRLECEGRLGTRVKDGPRQKQIAINLDAFGIKTADRFYLDLFIVRPETWGVQFTLRTGPEEFSHLVVTPQSMRGFLPEGYKVFDGLVWRVENWHSDEKLTEHISFHEEFDFLKFLELGWIEPRDRKAYMENHS